MSVPDAPRRESKAHRRRRALAIVEALKARYPEARIPLRHRSPLQLLIATILSAQCTDATVNKVTPVLFEALRDAQDFAWADRRRLEELIHPTGFFRQKARMIQEACRQILDRFGGEVPHRMEELLTLPGVGRKTANVLLSAAALEEWPGWNPKENGLGIVVDTHVMRLSRRLALSFASDPERIEQDLMQLVPPEEWASLPLRLIYFGRKVCVARRPRCQECDLLTCCPAGRHQGATPWLGARANRKV
ncbi:MAG: endonuclease III [Bacillota bacterium]